MGGPPRLQPHNRATNPNSASMTPECQLRSLAVVPLLPGYGLLRCPAGRTAHRVCSVACVVGFVLVAWSVE